MLRFSATLAALVLLAGLGACGQSGPLYMPGNPSQISTAPPEPVERTIETPEDDAAERDDDLDRNDRNDRDDGETN